MAEPHFDLATFIPYLLNRAAEKTSHDFENVYKRRYGMLRMEWRVLFHLGRYGALTAKEICLKGDLHKTKVSRAVAALESKRCLSRTIQPQDRRYETLSLSPQGRAVYKDLCDEAARYHENIIAGLPEGGEAAMIAMLQHLMRHKKEMP
jgi:DNA-binding MarR family transcriptional regulator